MAVVRYRATMVVTRPLSLTTTVVARVLLAAAALAVISADWYVLLVPSVSRSASPIVKGIKKQRLEDSERVLLYLKQQ